MEMTRCQSSERGLRIFSMQDSLRVETDLFLNDQNPSDVGNVDCLDVIRIVDKVWLDWSVTALLWLFETAAAN